MTSSLKINLVLDASFFPPNNVIVSPPFIKVAVVAIVPLTVISSFFNVFFNADLVVIVSKIPTPYA